MIFKLIMGLIFLCLNGVFIKYLPAPYFWLGAAWSIIFLVLFFLSRKSNLRALFLNLSIITFFLTGAEFYFWDPFKEKLILAGNMWSAEQYVKDDILGYVPRKNAVNIQGKKYYGDKTVIDMTYSTDQYGRRKSYPIDPKLNNAILFFGCSLTFGEGVNDDETLPYLVGLKQRTKFNTYNFGYSGYGPQQMLAAIEHKSFLKERIQEAPRFAFYTAIPGHISRLARLSTWIVAEHDPKYVLDERKEVYFAGHFDDNITSANLLNKKLRAHLSNSYILKKIFPSLNYYTKRQQTQEDIETYIKVIIKARDIFESRYPHSEFHVIFWDLYDFQNTKEVFHEVLSHLKEQNIRIHKVSDILPDFYQNNPLYQIPHDYHPTPLANQLISNYIAEQILH